MAGEPTRLARRLGLGDAVVIGLGAMIGAGVFAAIGPAADAAGGGLLIGLAIAAVVAFCNATSSAAAGGRLPGVRAAPTSTAASGSVRSGATSPGGASSSARPPAARRWRSPSAPTPRRSWQRPLAVAAVVAAHRRQLPRRPQDGVGSPASSSPSCSPSLAVVVVGALFGGEAARDQRRPDARAAGGRGILRVGRAAVLRLRRLRPHRHPRRGGDRPARTIPRAIPLALGHHRSSSTPWS